MQLKIVYPKPPDKEKCDTVLAPHCIACLIVLRAASGDNPHFLLRLMWSIDKTFEETAVISPTKTFNSKAAAKF